MAKIEMNKSVVSVLLLLFNLVFFIVAVEEKAKKEGASPSKEGNKTESPATTKTKTSENATSIHDEKAGTPELSQHKIDGLPPGMKVVYTNKVQDCESTLKPLEIAEVHLASTIQGGRELDSTRDRESVKLSIRDKTKMTATSRVMAAMCEGERLKVIAPANIMFDEKKLKEEKIAKDSILEFDIEMIKIIRPPLSVDSFEIIDEDDDGQVSQYELKMYLEHIGLDAVAGYLVESFFNYKDKNKDGAVTKEEIKIPIEEEEATPKHEEL